MSVLDNKNNNQRDKLWICGQQLIYQENHVIYASTNNCKNVFTVNRWYTNIKEDPLHQQNIFSNYTRNYTIVYYNFHEH